MERKVLITGATGATGKNAIAKLIELNIPVRAMVHKIDARSAELAAQGVEVVEGDLSDFKATAYFMQAASEEKVGLIDWSGIAFTHLRPTLFAEWLSYFAGEIKGNNRLLSPFGSFPYAPIAGEDTGRVIAAILADPDKFAGQTLELYGAEELTQQQVADLLSEELGRTITYIPMEIEPFGEILKKYFIPILYSILPESHRISGAASQAA